MCRVSVKVLETRTAALVAAGPAALLPACACRTLLLLMTVTATPVIDMSNRCRASPVRATQHSHLAGLTS